jgi:RNA polymerase sigma factor (sigma-70 family)
MAHVAWNSILRQVRRFARPDDGGQSCDAALLNRFTSIRDQEAFLTLVERHGPMVWGLCRRLLPRLADAEDAFQATFLVLVRKASGLRRPELLGAWLHGVAYRVAIRLRATVARRYSKERPFADLPAPDVLSANEQSELRLLLDDEVNRLPERYRVPFVLCHLEGLTNEEAARRLRCPKGTILSRLSRARERLRKQLTRRGIGLSTAALAAAFLQEGEAAVLPPALSEATAAAARAFATGAAESLSMTTTVTLAEGVLKSMFFTKLKIATATTIALTLMGIGTGLIARQGVALAEPPGSTPKRVPLAADSNTPSAEKGLVAVEPTIKLKGRRDLELRDALARPVEVEGWDDPHTTLQDLLNQLQDKFNVQFDVNERAFKFESVDDVLKKELVSPNPIRPMKATLDVILRKILSRIPCDSGATYLIRKDHIEITTGRFFWAETGPDLRDLDVPRLLDDGEPEGREGELFNKPPTSRFRKRFESLRSYRMRTLFSTPRRLARMGRGSRHPSITSIPT